MQRSWLSQWWQRWFGSVGSKPQRRGLRCYRSRLEQLEDRTLPSANFGFALGLGGISDDMGEAVATDAAGNVYVTGEFSGTVDFNPGPGTYNLTGVGNGDVFIAKYTGGGALVWVRQFGSTNSEFARDIAVDSGGNVYTTGHFFGTVDFDPGAGTYNLTSAGGADVFVSKLDSSGNFFWARRFGGTDYDIGQGIAVDDSLNVYTTGYFSGTADFNPGTLTDNLTSAGLEDVFVSKLSSWGNYIWAARFGGANDDQGLGIAVDGSGNVHTTGFFSGTADFNPGAGTNNLTSAGYEDVFVSKLSSLGNYLWAARFGGTGSDMGWGIAVDGSGNVHTTGDFSGTADFNPGAGTNNLTSAGAGDVFVSKLSSLGNYLWAVRFGGTGIDQGQGIVVDGGGNVYTTGDFVGTVDFNPGAGTNNLTSAGTGDVFVSKLSSLGNYLWARRFGGTSFEEGNGIAVDGGGNVYTTGDFWGTADFDPGPGTVNLTSTASNAVFVSKLVQQDPIVGDWNGDGIDDVGVFRQGQWILDSNGSRVYGSTDLTFAYGQDGDVPVVGDWNGDGRDDVGVFRNGLWILDSNGSRSFQTSDWAFAYGQAGDQTAVGDWNGDGRDDVGVFRNGLWILDSNGSRSYQVGDWAFAYGQAGDQTAVGDWNGDGRDDVGVFRNGLWILDRNGNRVFDAIDWVFAYG